MPEGCKGGEAAPVGARGSGSSGRRLEFSSDPLPAGCPYRVAEWLRDASFAASFRVFGRGNRADWASRCNKLWVARAALVESILIPPGEIARTPACLTYDARR